MERLSCCSYLCSVFLYPGLRRKKLAPDPGLELVSDLRSEEPKAIFNAFASRLKAFNLLAQGQAHAFCAATLGRLKLDE